VPELPDIVAYLEALEPRVVGRRIEAVRIASPFLVRSVEPPLRQVEGRRVVGLRRIGKRVVFQLEGDLFLVLHLMVAGRLHWKARGAKLAGRVGLAAFDFENGTLLLTEASTKKRASLHLARGEKALVEFDRGGIEPLEADLPLFREALTRENHTVKRALTDPRLFSGIGNAYSDEILHRARMSPAKLTKRMTEVEIERLYRAMRGTLEAWAARFVEDARKAFPEKVTAFREGMAVHGRYGKPCPVCGSPVQRIVYADNESNYCATCQTGGRLLADRALSPLLKGDWPKTLEELEERKGRSSAPLTPPLSPLRGGRGSLHPLPAGEGRGEGRLLKVVRARELRESTTDVEKKLWRRLRNRQLLGMKFRRQHPVGKYIVDFYCDEAKLAIELDGGQHASSSGYDTARTEALERLGIRVLRFWNNEVLGNLDGVLERIAEAIRINPPPSP
jgi:formamidopyrimidine-DNA glycosylase